MALLQPGPGYAVPHRNAVSFFTNECVDVAIEEIGLVLRVQRAGDHSLTRPLFVARPWFGDELGYPHTPEGRIPDFEFRHMA